MKSLKRRAFSCAMAGVLAASMVIPTSAASTQIVSTYEDIVIDVTVPETGEAQINPYGLPIKLDTTNSITGEQIVTKPLAIINKSATDLTVAASVTSTIKGTMKLAAEEPAADDTSKSAFVYLQMMKTTLDNSNLDATDAAVSGLKAADINGAVAAWSQEYDEDRDVVLNATRAAEGVDLVVLKAATPNSTDATKMEPQSGSIALFRLAGSVVESPREAWSSRDGFTATVAFTFKPDPAKVTVDKTAAQLTVATNGTLNLVASLVGTTSEIDTVTWESNPTSKATVVQDGTDKLKGTVTGVAAGPATITVTITTKNGATYVGNFEVTVTTT